MNSEIKLTVTNQELAGSNILGPSTCSGATGPSQTYAGYSTEQANTVDASTDAHIRRIVAEELAKSEERIAEMVVRKITDKVRLQAGVQR